jgi:hypothetical protein
MRSYDDNRLGSLPEWVTVHLDAGYDSGEDPRRARAGGLTGKIAHKGGKALSMGTV